MAEKASLVKSAEEAMEACKLAYGSLILNPRMYGDAPEIKASTKEADEIAEFTGDFTILDVE